LAPNVVVDGFIMTGKSPASAAPLAEALRCFKKN
jgi:putative intracellular protease/amidase